MEKLNSTSSNQSVSKANNFEKRFHSIRHLPHGHFNKYRQMFDAFTKRASSAHASETNDSSKHLLQSKPATNEYLVDNLIETKLNSSSRSSMQQLNKINISSDIMELPYTDDEKSSHLDKINHRKKIDPLLFKGVSDDTSNLLANLCLNNKQIAEFFDNNEAVVDGKKELINNTINKLRDSPKPFLYQQNPAPLSLPPMPPTTSRPISVYSLSSAKPSDNFSTNINTNDEYHLNVYKAIPFFNSSESNLVANIDDEEEVEDEKKKKTIPSQNQSYLDFLKSNNCECSSMDANNSKTTTTTNTTGSSSLISSTNSSASISMRQNKHSLEAAPSNPMFKVISNLENTAVNNTPPVGIVKIPGCESSYFEFDDIEFSDDSYDYDEEDPDPDYAFDDDESINSSSSNTSMSQMEASKLSVSLNDLTKMLPRLPAPPPKPLRTFEHDIYVNSKDLISMSFRRNDKTRSLLERRTSIKDPSLPYGNVYNDDQHVYEALASNSHKREEFHPKRIPNISNKINVFDIENTYDNTNEMNESLYYSKLTYSEPNLSQIDKISLKKDKNESSRTPFSKLFNTLRKTLSRVSINLSNDQLNKKMNEIDVVNTNKLNKYEIKQEYDTNVLRISTRYILDDSTNTNSITNKTSDQQCKYSSASQTLFYYAIIVGIRSKNNPSESSSLNETPSSEPYIQWQFPQNVQVDSNISNFCFPDLISRNETTYKNMENQIFRFTLTNFKGSRTYGYCIKLAAEIDLKSDHIDIKLIFLKFKFNLKCNKNKTPIVVCIASHIDVLEMYHTILNEVEKLYASSLTECKVFLEAIYSKRLPNLGESMLVTIGDKISNEIVLYRCFDKRLENINLFSILKYPFDFIIKIFSSILLEKKLVFLSSKLSILSNTIQQFETLLYPFTWPHTYIPLLPSYLIEMIEAPTPYIIGMTRTCKDELLKYDYESDMIIIDLDKQKITPHDSNTKQANILPDHLLKILKADLANLSSMSRTVISDYHKNMQLCQVFMKLFVKTMTNYKDYIFTEKVKFEADSMQCQRSFMYKEFVSDANVENKKFLEHFTQTQLFEVFIAKKLASTSSSSKFGFTFDKAINEENEACASNPTSCMNTTSSSSMMGATFSPKLTIKQLKNRAKSKKLRF